MKRTFGGFAAVAAIVLGACGDSPTEVTEGALITASGDVVVTEGIAAPEWVPVTRTASSDAHAQASLGGSMSSPVSLLAACAGNTSQAITVTYTVTGRQVNPASFKVNSQWTFNGSGWSGSTPVTVNVPARAQGDAGTVFPVTVTVVNASATGSGTSTLEIAPFGLVTEPQATLNVGAAGVIVYVAFLPCETTANMPPVIVVPSDITIEATSATGAVVGFLVTASDQEDGDLTSAVECDWTSGDTFPLGTTTVSCSVTDTNGATTSGSFDVTVEDTTPAYFTSIPTGTLTAIAVSATGAAIDLDTFNITVEDFGNVSEPSDYECDYVGSTVLAIGTTTTISCTATDYVGNESLPSTFDIFIGLNVASAGFLPPLRNESPFSAHRRGSTIPHKFSPPTYADGTPATDLSGGLRLALRSIGGDLPGTEIEANDYMAGSTEWRYDPADGLYIFNLKSQTAWQLGAWQTTVSFAGITLAQTEFVLKK